MRHSETKKPTSFLILDLFAENVNDDADDLGVVVVRVDPPLVNAAALAIDLFGRYHDRGLHSLELAANDTDYGIWSYQDTRYGRYMFGPLSPLDRASYSCVTTDIDPTTCVVDGVVVQPRLVWDMSIRFWLNRWLPTSEPGFAASDLRVSIKASTLRTNEALTDAGGPPDIQNLILTESQFVAAVELARLL